MADDLAPRYRDPSQPVAERISDLGHGRGYTTFAYSDLAQAQARVPIDGSEDIALAFTVRNTGGRSGVEVAQLYVRDCHASVVRPVRELKAFQRLVLAQGEAVRVQFSVPVDMLQLTDHSGGWFDLMVGPSSACTPLTAQVEVVGVGGRVLPVLWRMESCGEVRGL
jgi:beta-glucosidase